MYRTDLAGDNDRCRVVVNAVINFRISYNAGNFLTSCEPITLSRRNLFHGVIY